MVAYHDAFRMYSSGSALVSTGHPTALMRPQLPTTLVRGDGGVLQHEIRPPGLHRVGKT